LELLGMAKRNAFDDFENDDQDDGFLTFDAREEDEDRSRGPLIIAAIVAVLLICGIILWQLYESSRTAEQTPQVAADTGAFKSNAIDGGGTPALDLEKGVFGAAEGVTAPPLDVQPAQGGESPLVADTGTIPAPAAPSASDTTASPLVPAPSPQPKPTAPIASSPPKEPKPVVKAAPAPTKVAVIPPKVVKAPAAKAPAPVPVQIAGAPAPVAAAAATGIGAQLGSFQSRAAAETALTRYRTSGLTGPVSVVAADLGAKGTWYRIRATGFETRSEVEGFCTKARGAGAQCIPSSK
jgi:cytoskeletal protein RodZ